jgi:MYXO-CTERM domain-containing protein
VFGAYMEINTADHQYVEHSPAKPGFAGLDYVVTHEAGHFLGLAHSDDADALMYAHYKNEEATLHADDIAAICALEPATEPETKGCACSVRTSKSNAALVLVALGLVIVRLRPRTPRR